MSDFCVVSFYLLALWLLTYFGTHPNDPAPSTASALGLNPATSWVFYLFPFKLRVAIPWLVLQRAAKKHRASA